MSNYRYEVPCFSAYPYVKTDHVAGENDKAYQRLIFAVKDGTTFRLNGNELDPYKLVATNHGAKCEELTSEAIVVPVPRSTVTPAVPTVIDWPGLQLAKALIMSRNAGVLRVALRRHSAVKKAAKAKSSSDRPTVQQHIDSLWVDLSGLNGVEHIVLVDDVLTRGAQMMGAARALQLAGYTGTISGFTAGHTDNGGRVRAHRSIVRWDGISDYPLRSPRSLRDLYQPRGSHRDD